MTFVCFKRFVKFRKNCFINTLKKQNVTFKIILIFALVYLNILTNTSFKKLNDNQIKQGFNLFFDIKKQIKNFDSLLLIFNSFLKDNDNKNLVNSKNLKLFYDYLKSFYLNSHLLNKYQKKLAVNQLKWEESEINKYIDLNHNLKMILNLLKNIIPKDFNHIYRKILFLT